MQKYMHETIVNVATHDLMQVLLHSLTWAASPDELLFDSLLTPTARL